MLRYILLRVSSIPLVMFVVITIIFSLTHIVPGGAIQVSLGPHATVERVDAFKAKYGLNDKSQAINLMAQQFEAEVMEPELRPEFIKKMKRIMKKGKVIKVKNFAKEFGLKK